MSNVLLAYDNNTQRTVGAFEVVDGWGNYDSSFINLTSLSLAQRWISPGLATADTRRTFRLGGTISMFGLANHNFSLGATVQLLASNVSNFASLVYDSGVLPAYATGVTAASKAGLRCNFMHKLTTPTSAAYWRVAIADASNPAGYIAAGRMFAGTSILQPQVNMLAGASLGWEDKSEIQVALNGAEYFTDKEPCRVLRFKLDRLSLTEAMGGAFDLQRVAASSRREVWCQFDPADGEQSVRRSIFGRVRVLSPIEEPYVGSLATAFEIKELL